MRIFFECLVNISFQVCLHKLLFIIYLFTTFESINKSQKEAKYKNKNKKVRRVMSGKSISVDGLACSLNREALLHFGMLDASVFQGVYGGLFKENA